MINRSLARLSRRLLAVATGLLALYLLALTGQRALDAYRARQDVEAVRQEIALLKGRNLELQAELSSPRLDEEIERTARQELGLVRPGDHPIVLIWPAGRSPERVDGAEPTAVPEPVWRGWLRLFFDTDPPLR